MQRTRDTLILIQDFEPPDLKRESLDAGAGRTMSIHSKLFAVAQ
jgi:hypothetical protein